MGFYTSLTYYRPGKPPVVSTSDLARLLVRIQETRLTGDCGFMDVSLKYGPAINRNSLPSVLWQPILDAGRVLLLRSREIKWDLSSRFTSLDAIIEALQQTNRSIYRCRLGLGLVVEDVRPAIFRLNSPENSYDFTPGELSLEIGPIENGLMASDHIQVGWMSLNLHGYGYLYPWSSQQAIERVLSVPEIRLMMAAARESFPVAPKTLDRKVIATRRKLWLAWPYESIDDVPYDWCWGVREG